MSPSISRQSYPCHNSYRLTLQPGSLGATDDWLDELVGDIGLVALLDSLDQVALDLVTLALHQPINGNLDSVPSLVSVHGVVSPDHSRDFSNTLLLEEIL